MSPRPKKSVKLPPSIWIVFQREPNDGPVVEGSGAVYIDQEEIGNLMDDEIVAHYHLVAKKNRSTSIN